MTSCAKWKRTSSPDAPAKCRDVENASAFETRSAPNLARCYPRSFAFYLGNPFLRFWHEFNRLPAHVQCLAREKFQLWVRDPFHPSIAVQAACRKRLVSTNRRSLSRCCAKARRSRRLVLDRHTRRLQQLHQAVAVTAELFGQRLAGATDCGGGPLSFAALPSISESFELGRVPALSPLPSRFYLLCRASARSIPRFLTS